MLPKIETFSFPAQGVAVDRNGQADPIFIIPFRNGSLTKVYALDETTILFVGRLQIPSSQPPTLLLAKYDLTLKRMTHEKVLPDVHGSHFVLSTDKKRLYVICHAVRIVNLTTIELSKTYQVAVFDGSKGRLTSESETGFPPQNDPNMQWLSVLGPSYLGEPKAGRLGLIQTFELDDGDGRRRLVTALDVDLENDKFESRTLVSEMASASSSPDAYASRLLYVDFDRSLCVMPAVSFVPFSSGKCNGQFSAFGCNIAEIEPHPDVKSDGVKRFGIAVKFLDFSGPEVTSQTHIIRMATAAEWAEEMYSQQSPSDVETSLLFRAASLSAGASDTVFSPEPGPWSDTLKYYPTRNPLTRFINELVKDPLTGQMWLLFSNSCLRSIEWSGALGPLVFLCGEGGEVELQPGGTIRVRVSKNFTTKTEYKIDPSVFGSSSVPVFVEASRVVPYLDPQRHQKAFSAFARSQFVKQFKLADWSPQCCSAALQEETKLISESYQSLINPSEFRLNFDYVIAGNCFDEIAFFQNILDRKFSVAGELRELLNAYLDQIGKGGEGQQPWQADEGIAGLGSAMRALVLMEPNAVDVFREYLMKRDFEHESYCWRVILPEFFDLHNIKSVELLRFGVFSAFNQISGQGLDESFDRWGLMRAASRLVSPVEFVDILLSEVEPFGLRPEWNFKTDDYLSQFAEFLDENDQYQAQVWRELADRRPSLVIPSNR